MRRLLSVCLSLAAVRHAIAITAQGGFFRQSIGKLIYERVDPIVQPGVAPSSHAHLIAGASSFAPTLTSASLRKSACTTASTQGDFSAYWQPMLFFAYANGSFQAVEGGMQTYYHMPKALTDSFPDDFRMVAGQPTRTSFDPNNVAHKAFQFRCLGSNGQTLATDWPMTDWAEINFPSCWNGKAYAADNSHVAYPTGGPDADGSPCPAGYDRRLPRIFIENYLSISPFKDLWSQARNTSWPFVWANGNASPYGYHGDFAFGWDPDIFNAAIEGTNNNAAGNIDTNAPMLKKNDVKCNKTPDVDEQVLGLLPALPGCGTIFDASTGPKMRADCVDNPDVLTPAVGYVGDTPPAGACSLSGGAAVLPSAKGFGWVGCLGYENARPLATDVDGDANSVATCLSACAAAGLTSCGIEYGGQCYGSSSAVAISQQGSCTMACRSDPAQSCGGPKSLDLYVRDASPAVDSTCKRVAAKTFNAGNGAAAANPDAAPPRQSSPTSQPGFTQTTSVNAAGQTSTFFQSTEPDSTAIGSAGPRRLADLHSLLTILAFTILGRRLYT